MFHTEIYIIDGYSFSYCSQGNLETYENKIDVLFLIL